MAYTYQTVRHELWLYLPQRLEWFNPAHIVTIAGGAATDDGPLDMYVITLSVTEYGPQDLVIDDPDDVAAITAWLEARS